MKQLLAPLSDALDATVRLRDRFLKNVYSADGMRLKDKQLAFLKDPRFVRAYQRGMNSGHHICRPKGSTVDIHVEYRVYIECWAAEHALRLPGDFVCCGVNTGIMPLAICEYVDINVTDKRFWLFDTFEGIPESQMLATERAPRLAENEQFYSECFGIARRNFESYRGARLVRGTVPETLATAKIERISYLSIDMNIAYPERKAMEHFWPLLTSGAIVVFDDYAQAHYTEQFVSMNEFADGVGASVLILPTGQGMMIKI
jgi:hypothetical protein